jgi:predicted Zn-dependent protease
MSSHNVHLLRYILPSSWRRTHTKYLIPRVLTQLMLVTVFNGAMAHAALPSEMVNGGTNHKVSGQGDQVQQQQHHGNAIRQSKQKIEIIQKIQEGRIPQVPLEEIKTDTITTKLAKGQSLGVAWQEFKRHNYQSAIELFTTLSSNPAFLREAKYGLAMCYAKLKNTRKATQLLQELAAGKPQYKETLPKLVSLLIEQGQFERAKFYANQIDGTNKSIWLSNIDEGIVRGKIHDAQQSKDTEKLKSIIKEHQQDLQQCGMPDVFYEIAGLLAQDGKKDDAVVLYRSLLSCSQKTALRIGSYNALRPLVAPVEMLSLLEAEKTTSATSPDYLNKIRSLKLDILHDLLQTESENTAVVAEKILKIRPDDPVATSALSWSYFKDKRYDEAYDGFSRLHKNDPGRADYAAGLIYCLIKLKRFDEALVLAKKYENNEKIAPLLKEIRLATLWDKVDTAASESSDIEGLAQEILSINPDDENIKPVLAWWYFRNDNFEKSYGEFKRLYDKKPDVKDHSYGLALSLEKLERIDEAIEVAEKHKGDDERSATLLAEMYLDKAKSAYKVKKYQEAQLYAEKALVDKPDDATTQELLDLYRYKQTVFSRSMSLIEGLSGSSYGSVTQDLVGSTGLGVSASIKQGIDWIKLPWDIVLSTYGEYKYSTRTSEKRYFDDSGYGVGIEFNKSVFKVGAEYFWDTLTQQNQTKITELLYLSWYHDWTKRIWFDDEEGSWLKMDALSGSTYGKTTHDFAGLTGTSISGYINQGIDWFTLPGGITFNTYAEYRFSFRTKDTLYYNAHGPAVGLEFQKKPFTLGSNWFYQMYPERGIVDRQVGVYLRWYYDWDLKPNKDR